MGRINQEVMKFVDEATELFKEDFREKVIHNNDYVAIREGINETDLTVFKVVDELVFENQFEEQSVTRIEIDESNRRYSIERKYNRLMKYLEEKHPDIIKNFEIQDSDLIDSFY